MSETNGHNAKDSLEDLPLEASSKYGLQLLLQASFFARDVHCDVWDFAVGLPALVAAGLFPNELRWLICKGLVDHARETTASGDSERSFQIQNNLALQRRSCFALTEKGSAVLGPRDGHVAVVDRAAGPSVREPDPSGNGRLAPTWDRNRQELRLGPQVIKEFKLPSPNQQIILSVFEEEGWPIRIDDPLPPHPEIASKRRLLDTIKSLNGRQKQRLVRFRGDGSGEGVRWELVKG